MNVYNALVVHGIAALGAPTNLASRLAFFGSIRYNIGAREAGPSVSRPPRRPVSPRAHAHSDAWLGDAPPVTADVERLHPLPSAAVRCPLSAGGLEYSPDDIENGILRGNRPSAASVGALSGQWWLSRGPFASGDPRRRFVVLPTVRGAATPPEAVRREGASG